MSPATGRPYRLAARSSASYGRGVNLKRIADHPVFGFLVLVAALLACGRKQTSSPAAVTAAGYRHGTYYYHVQAAPDGRLMPPAWNLDNFQTGQKDLKPKTGGIYMTNYELDVDGDGKFESIQGVPTYDLRFKHAEDAGVIFLRTIPISQDMGAKNLRVMMTDFVEGVAGAGYEVVSLNQGSQVVVEKRYAAAVVDEGPAELAGVEAYFATMDVANLDQVKVDPKARKDRVQLVILHTKFSYQPPRNVSKQPTQFPVLMVLGYANQEQDFARGLPEFHDLLGRVAIDGTQGFSIGAAPTSGPTAPASRPTAPASSGLPAPASAPAPPIAPSPSSTPAAPVDSAAPAPAAAPAPPASAVPPSPAPGSPQTPLSTGQ